MATIYNPIIGNSDWTATGAFNTTGGWNNPPVGPSGNWVWGSSAADTFTFAAYSDITTFANNVATFNGAGATDVLSFAGAWTSGATFNLGQLSTVAAGGNNQIWSVSGTTLSDAFIWSGTTSSTTALSLNGSGGTDTLQLQGVTNAVYTLANTNMTNMEWIVGSSLNDNVLWTTASTFTFDLGDGTDTLDISSSTTARYLKAEGSNYTNIEYFMGSSLADSLAGSGLNTITETLSGGSGKDILWGAAGNDLLIGGKDADTYYFGAADGFDTISQDNANSASDVVFFRSGYTSDMTEYAALTFNVATNGVDVNIGIGGSESLTLAGWVNYSGSTNASTTNDKHENRFVVTEGTFGLAIANDAIGTSLFGTVSNLNYLIKGGASGDTLKAGATSADKLSAGLGCDLMWYSSTAGSFDGGGDTDTLSAYQSEKAVSIMLSDSTYTNVEYLTGSSMADILGGTSSSETLNGGKSADSLWGAAGDDSLIGGAGADSFWFGVGGGADTVGAEATASDNKTDVIQFFDSTFASLTFARTGGGDADVSIAIFGTTDTLILQTAGTKMGSNSFDRVNKFITTDMTFGLNVGTSAGESMLGTSIADYIVGGDGADTLNGLAGGDALYGQDGDDLIYYTAASWIDGGAGSNTISASGSTAGVTVLLGDAATKVLNAQTFVGSSYADQLGGTSTAETLQGGAGSDSLWGGAGEDLLDGGNGSDSYWFGVGNGADTIASSTANGTDVVMFYGDGIAGGGITSTVLSGYNLTIGLSSGDSLTLADWSLSASNKLNKFNFGSYGNYSLAVSSTNVATWTKIS